MRQQRPFDVDEAANLAATIMNDAVQQAARRLRRAGCPQAQIEDVLVRAAEFLSLHLEDEDPYTQRPGEPGATHKTEGEIAQELNP